MITGQCLSETERFSQKAVVKMHCYLFVLIQSVASCLSDGVTVQQRSCPPRQLPVPSSVCLRWFVVCPAGVVDIGFHDVCTVLSVHHPIVWCHSQLWLHSGRPAVDVSDLLPMYNRIWSSDCVADRSHICEPRFVLLLPDHSDCAPIRHDCPWLPDSSDGSK